MIPDLRGKTIVVTGATSGLGRAVASQFAELGATVVIGARDMRRGEQLAAELRSRYSRCSVDVIEVDLRKQRSIRPFASVVLDRHPAIDALINNAGIVNKRRVITEDGVEETMAVNVIAPFLLSQLLLPALRRAPHGRIVNLTSRLHAFARFDLANMNGERHYHGIDAYARSALARILNTYSSAESLKLFGIDVNAIHPGGVKTNIGMNNRGLRVLLYKLLRFFMATPESAARAVVRLATAPELEGITGRYFSGPGEVRSSDQTYDPILRSQCWDWCRSMTGL